MKYTPKQVTMDLEEFKALELQIEICNRQPEDGSLTIEEQQEATGTLLVRALQNPSLFRTEHKEIDLGKFKAIFVTRTVTEQSNTPTLLIRFVRT